MKKINYKLIIQAILLYFSLIYLNPTESKSVPENLSNQGKVELKSKGITRLQTNAFVSLTKCIFLVLQHNDIRIIEKGAFNGLEKVSSLSLNQNKIKHLGKDIFKGLTKCTNLNIQHNDIKTIKIGAFNGLEKVSTLSLNQNKITKLEKDQFLGHCIYE